MKPKPLKKPKGDKTRPPVTTTYQPFSWSDFETDILDTDEDVVMKHAGEFDILDTDEDVVMLQLKNTTTQQETVTPFETGISRRIKRSIV